MDAVILAAGAGTRLRPLTASRPKCLVPIDANTLLDHQVHSLVQAGVEQLYLVVGYRHQMVREHCGDGDRYGVRIDYIENADWETTNSIYSLYLARGHWSYRDTFVCNCDILFDRRLPQRLARQEGSGIAVDTRRDRLAGEMNVRLDAGGRVTGISKQLAPASTQAVSAQIALLRADDGGLVGAEVERLVEGDQRDTFPTAAYGPLVEAGRLRAVDIADLPWAEIDSVEEYDEARERCAPRLQPLGGGD